jgi:RHS repeat-associated protein
MICLLPPSAQAQPKTFLLRGASLSLQDASSDVDVFFSSMRFNRISNVWNFEVSLTNHSNHQLSGPIVLSIDSFTGTSGPLLADGVDDNGKAFYDLSATVPNANLVTGTRSLARTLTLGFNGSAPKVATRVFVRPPTLPTALATTRTLDETGQPLPDVQVIETGPNGVVTNRTDPVFGVVTLGQATGSHTWQFSAPGWLPVWRQGTLTTNDVVVIPNPQLAQRASNSFTLTPIAGGQITNSDSSIQIVFPPGSVLQPTIATLTTLSAQILPAFLPVGWSPLQEFWLELNSEPTLSGNATLILQDTLSKGEIAALVRWNEVTVRWDVVQVLTGTGSTTISSSLAGSGAYAVVAPDALPFAPAAPLPGAALAAATANPVNAAALTASGKVDPTISPASLVPQEVTARATVIITNSTGPMSSGLVLRGDVREQYQLRNSFAGLPPAALGQRRMPPRYESFLVGYQRPGVGIPSTLQMQFPLRPLLLFGPEELDQATVTMDVLAPGPFSGGVIDTNGGLVASQGIGVLAGAGDLLARQAVQIRVIDATNFLDFATNGISVISAFELSLAGVAPGRHLVAQLGTLPTNGTFVLAQLKYQQGLYGLQPVERLNSDSQGRASTGEPLAGERLTGIFGSGQYLLLQVPSMQGIVSGIAKNSAGLPTPEMPVQIPGQPWLALSGNNGAFQLLSPTGQVQVLLTDLTSGDTGAVTVSVTDPLSATIANPDTVSIGPSIVSVNPTNGATGVPRVTPIVVTFSKPVNPATLLNGGLQLLASNGIPVQAALTINLKNNVATLLPSTQLDPSTTHTIVLSTNISDSGGLGLQGPTSFTFATESDLLNRDSAKLTIYQPGATNIPATTLNNLPGFTPGTNGADIVAEGSAGTADPGQAVILINETTGETSTTLSKSDGSFYGVVHGGPDDFISAALQNQNGTHTVVRAAQQKFDDGSVGLFNGGGTVQADGEGGAFQIIVPPGTVRTKTIFRLQPMTLQEVTNSLPTPPLDAQVIGGMKIAMQPNDVSGDTDVSLPMDPNRIHLPDGATPEDGAYALALVRQLEDGGVGYQIVDKLKYANGRLHSNTTPFQGFGDAIMDSIAQNPAGVLGLFLSPANHLIEAATTVLVLGTRPVTVTGRVGFCPSLPSVGGCVDEAADQFLQGLVLADSNLGGLQQGLQSLVSGNRTPLPGAFVSLIFPDVASGRTGRLQPGLAYATSDRQGRYALVLPFANAGYVLQATHPRFQEHKAVPLIPFVDYQLGAGAVYRSFGFDVPIASDTAPRLDVAHAPLFPATNQTARLIIDVIHSGPVTIQPLVDSVIPSTPGTAQIKNRTDTQLGTNQTRVQADVTANGALTARIKVSVTPSNPDTPSATAYHNVVFGFLPPAVTNLAIQSDPNDKTPPQIERTSPLAGGVILVGAPISLFFNEPIDASVAQQASQFTLDDPSAGEPRLTFSPDQTRLDIFFGALKPDKQYELTVGAPIADLAGNQLILPPTVNGGTFKLKFRTLPIASTALSSVNQGGGVAINGNYAYVLDRTGSGKLLVYDISNPSQPNVVSDTITFIGEPRDLVLLPRWAHVRKQDGSPQTNDFLAVVGGNLGSSSVTGGPGSDGQDVNIFFQGQYLRVFDISDPAHPTRVLGTALTLRPDAVTKIRWDPPYLAFLEIGSDFQQVGLINLQAMFIGFNATADQIAHFPPEGFAGKDGVGTNAPDGDYVDPNERVPLPQHSPIEFFGRDRSFLPDLNFGARHWLDFDFKARGNYCGVVFREGAELDRLGNPTGNTLPPGYRTLALGDLIDAPTATLPFKVGAVPKRLFTLLNLDVGTDQAPDIRNLALVSLSPDSDGLSKLAVIDITIPASPVVTNLIVLRQELNLGLAQSLQRRPDGLLALATTTDLVLLDPHQLLTPSQGNGLSPVIVGIVPGAGSGNVSLGMNNAGVDAVALGGRSDLILEAPRLQFVRVLRDLTITDPKALANDPAQRQQVFDAMTLESAVGPARFHTNGNAVSTLTPANSTNHYYVLMRAPGGAGDTIKLGLQALNRSGYPLRNKGRDFAPVRAISDKGSQLLQQRARDGCDAPISELTAYRLAGDQEKSSPFYNLYLSKPFALVYERISADEIKTLKMDVDRELLWSDFYIEAFIDPDMQNNGVLGPFAAHVGADSGSGSDLIVLPRASAVAESFPGTYIPGPNPPPTGDPEKMPGTFGTISANNGEFRSETIDVVLPSRHMPIIFERVLGGQDVYEGPFGRGWDFTYNQRLTVLRPDLIAHDHRLALVVRALARDSTVAQSGDLLWHTGRGRLVLYTHTNQAPSEVAGDPLLDILGLRANIRTYYLPSTNEAAIFDPIFEFQDGQFVRLTPDGRQYWYDRAGLLQKVYDRYPKNYHELHYNQRGELTKIVDASFDNEIRFLNIGYYRLEGDSEFNADVDVRTNATFVAGKIAQLTDYAGRSVNFGYSADGVLASRLGFEGSSANNGEGGRPATIYLYTDECSGFLQGITAGGQNPTAPLVSVAMDAQSGVPSGNGGAAGGSITLTPPTENSAEAAAANATGIGEPDGAHVSYAFDAHGFPKQADFTGPNNGMATIKTTYGTYGLLTHVEYPLGDTVDYTYDTNNTLLRSRANLTVEVHTPGSRGGPTLTRSISSYDPRYNLPVNSQTDFNGKSAQFALTTDGRDVHTITYQDVANPLTLDYNEFGQVEKETTPDGVVIDPEYDSEKGFKSSEKRGSFNYQFGYDSSVAGQLGMPTSVTLPPGDQVFAVYDSRLLLLQVSRATRTEKRGYDRNGNPKYIERDVASGATSGKLIQERSYNNVGFLEKVTTRNIEVNGQVTDLVTEFHSSAQDSWRVREIVFPDLQTKQINYDHLGYIIGMTLGSYSESYGRDLDGNLTSLTQGGKLTHEYFYDGHDRMTNEVAHLDVGDEKTGIGYFGNGQVAGLQIVDPQFGTVYQASVDQFDGLGRPRQTTMTGSTISASRHMDYSSSAAGGSVVVTGPRDVFTTIYDGAGRVTERKDSLADLTLSPDGNGNILSTASKEGTGFAVTYNTSAGYDALDHPQTLSDDLGTRFTLTPRLDGAIESVVDGEGRQVSHTFTLLGEPTSKARQSGVKFVYQYNKNRQQTLLADGSSAGETTTFDSGTLRILHRALRSGATYDYNSPNFLNQPEQVSMPGGGTMKLSHDNKGRLLSQDIDFSQGQAYHTTFQPDALGRVRKMNYGVTGGNSAVFDYDKLGPLLSATYNEELGTFVVTDTIREDGSRATLTYPSHQAQLSEDRDAGMRLQAIHQGGSELWKVNRYDGATQRGEVILGGLIKETSFYDSRRRIGARRYERISDSALLADVRYGYDRADNRVLKQEVHRHGRADAFGYDQDNRLMRVDAGLRPTVQGAVRQNSAGLQAAAGLASGLFSRAFSYDTGHFDLLVGAATSNPNANQLPPVPPFMTSLVGHDSMLFPKTLDGQSRPAPDPLGNTLGTVLQIREAGKAEPTAVNANLLYNGLSHLVHVDYNNNGTQISVDYDTQPNGLVDHRKLSRNGTVVEETALVYDNGRLLEEFVRSGGSNQLRARYYYADEDSPFASDLDDGTGNLKRFYYLRDAQGSVMAIADDAGNIVERVSYDPWGQPTIQARDQASPRVSAVIQSTNNELLVQFTELVLPPLLNTGPGTNTVTACANLVGSFQLANASGPINLGSVVYAEDSPGFSFGTVVRLRPQGTPTGTLTLSVNTGSLVDEWGLPNASEQFSITLSAPGSVLFQGPAVGSTAPPRVARSAIGSPFLFHGQYFDYDTGLVFLRARFYDPFTGQFLQQDPVPYGDSVNPYAGMGNNPTTLRDPSGRTLLKKLLANAQARQRARRAGGADESTAEDPRASSSPGSRRSRGGSGVDPDATTEMDQPAIHDLSTRADAIADSDVDTVVTLRPPGGSGGGGGGSGGGPPTPPSPKTDRVWRGMKVPIQGSGVHAVLEQLQAGSLLSPNEFHLRQDPTGRRSSAAVRAEQLARIGQRMAQGHGLGDFSAEEMTMMSETELLALWHIEGSSDDAIGISTALNPFHDEGAVRWAGFGPVARRGGTTPTEDEVPLMIEFEVDRGSGEGPFNLGNDGFAEGNEVTFFDELRFRRAWVYVVSEPEPGRYELHQIAFFPGAP